MRYCMVSDEGKITNIILCDSSADAALFGARPDYEGAVIGGDYAPPPAPPPEPEPPTELERLRADVDFLAAMQGVML